MRRRSERVGSLLILSAVFVVCAPSLHAQANVAGRYHCKIVKVAGQSAPCRTAPLVSRADGRYEICGEEGRYEVAGKWVILSNSKRHGKGEIRPGHEIVFRYRYRGRTYQVTFERRFAELGDSSLS